MQHIVKMTIIALLATASGMTHAEDMMVNLRMTPQEQKAHHIWTLRAGLNVAGLQCHKASILHTASQYNDFLRQHARELKQAQITLTKMFARAKNISRQAAFDRYTTQSYNAFSTLKGQVGFCQEASRVGASAIATPRLDLHLFAPDAVARLTAATQPQPDPLQRIRMNWVALPAYDIACIQVGTSRSKQDCQ